MNMKSLFLLFKFPTLLQSLLLHTTHPKSLNKVPPLVLLGPVCLDLTLITFLVLGSLLSVSFYPGVCGILDLVPHLSHLFAQLTDRQFRVIFLDLSPDIVHIEEVSRFRALRSPITTKYTISQSLLDSTTSSVILSV